jgi:hypothetical protein
MVTRPLLRLNWLNGNDFSNKGGKKMDKTRSDRFALEAFTFAFRIQRILESNLVGAEAKEKLVQDFARLKEKVEILSKIRENKELARKMNEPTRIGNILE